MSAPVVLVDMDGVVAEWVAGVLTEAAWKLERHWSADERPEAPTASQVTEFNINHCFAGAQLEAVKMAMAEPDLYADLKPVPGAAEALHGMVAQGLEVFLCSSPDLDNPTCASDKLEWVERHLGRELAARTILTKDKTAVLGDLLIDDKPEVTGLHVPRWTHVVFDQPYNRQAQGPRLHGWAHWRQTLLPLLAQAA